MLTLNKTKAALQSCQCHYEKPKQIKHTRVNAGGQSLSAPVISGTAPLAHTPFPQIWGDLEQRAGSTAIQHTPEISRSFDRYPNIGYRCEENRIGQNQSYKNSGGQTPEDFQSAFMHSGYHSLSASLAFLRWRRLISPRIEVTINCDVLSSLSLTSSIASTTSCGTLAFRACDFAFFVPVAITESPLYWWATVYTKKGDRKALTWATPCNYSGPHLDFVKVKNNEAPRVSLPLAELLTNNRYHGAKNG